MILWGMPDYDFDHVKYASGECVLPSPWPPDCQSSGCGLEGYRDLISGFDLLPGNEALLINRINP